MIDDTDEDVKTGIMDLLGCLRHLTDPVELDWDEALNRSTVHYGDEVGGEL